MSEEKKKYIETVISDGRVVRSRIETKGRDLRRVDTLTGPQGGRLTSIMAEVAITGSIDGKALTFEEILDWLDADIIKVQHARQEAREAQGKDPSHDSASDT